MAKQALPKYLSPRAEGRRLAILVVDDYPLIREGLANALTQLARQVNVLQADSVKRALAELKKQPEITLVLLELALPDNEGTSAVTRIRELYPNVPVVVLSALDDSATVRAALDGGARGFISKRSSSTMLLNALRLVLAGEVYVPPEALGDETARAAVREPKPPAAPRRTSDRLGLTQRQLDVLRLLVQGNPNKTICRELRLAEGTVRTHVAAIFRALHVSNRTQAVFAVSRLGIKFPFAVAPEDGDQKVAWDPVADCV